MPLFSEELPEIGKPFVAIPEDGDGAGIEIYIRDGLHSYTDSGGKDITTTQCGMTGENAMKYFYSEWVYCETRPYFEQEAERRKEQEDYENRNDPYYFQEDLIRGDL